MHRLRERPVTCRIPRGETNPFLSGGVERNAVVMGGERRPRQQCRTPERVFRQAVFHSPFSFQFDQRFHACQSVIALREIPHLRKRDPSASEDPLA